MIDCAMIEKELKSGTHIIIQFYDNNYNDKMLSELNELCSKNNENFSIRFYGDYSSIFNCKTLEKISNVKSLYVDCLRKVENIESLTKLKHLQLLSLGVYELKDSEILKADNLKNLKELIIDETKTRGINLEYLKEYEKLERLFIFGHTKNIESIGHLSALEFLRLGSISKVSVDFINRLSKLKTLQFTLGGRENINELEENEIEDLEIIRVRGFNDFTNVTNFKKLRNLLIEDQIRLLELNFDRGLEELENLKILNCKTFTSLTGLENLPKLNQLRIYKANIDFNSFIKQKRPESLKILWFYTTKTKSNKEIIEELTKMGYSDGREM